MYQSSTRKNFLDTLLDPTTIAILASIALHASIGAILPFFTQPDKEAKKAGPTTVKVVQLTPSELQRIPQAPQVPTPQVLPSARPTVPSRPAAAPPNTKFSTAPQTIPFSPLRPSDGTIFKPPTLTKQQKAVPQKQPVPPDFDPENIFKPKKTATKPTPQVSPPVKKQTVKKTKPTLTPAPDTATDDDGGENPPTTDPAAKNSQAQQPSATPQPTPKPTPTPTTTPKPTPTPTTTPKPTPTPTTTPNPTPTPTTTPKPQSSGTPTGNSDYYGDSTRSATTKIQEYLRKYPDMKTYPSKKLIQQYPPGIACSKVKQPAYIVLMVAFDKIPEGQDSNILGNVTSPLLNDEKPYINGDPAILVNKKLMEVASTAGFLDATAADRKRPATDKGKPVLYPYRVEFDRTSCKQ